MKDQRWYERKDGVIFVYDQPHSSRSQSVSIVEESDLRFYRNNFNLTKVWNNEDFSTQ